MEKSILRASAGNSVLLTRAEKSVLRTAAIRINSYALFNNL